MKYEIARRKRQNERPADSIAFVSQPVPGRAARGGREIVEHAVTAFGWYERPLEVSKRHGTEQCQSQPIEGCPHAPLMPGARTRRKAGGRGLLLLTTGLLVCGCGSPQPTGQVLASVDGTEVTQRELSHELATRRAQAGTAPSRPELLEEIIDRKLLVEEARQRNLEQDSRYHFDMRRTRETLLVDALQRDLARRMPPPDPEELATYIRTNPWRFSDRFVLLLSPSGAGSGTVEAIFDSAELSSEPASEIRGSEPGATIVVNGANWVIVARREVPLTASQAAAIARDELRELAIAAQLRQIVQDRRDRVRIRYQTGQGPAGR